MKAKIKKGFQLLFHLPPRYLFNRLRRKMFSGNIFSAKRKFDDQNIIKTEIVPSFPVNKTNIKRILRSGKFEQRLYVIAQSTRSHIFDLLGSGALEISYDTEVKGFEGYRYTMAPGEKVASAIINKIKLHLKNNNENTGSNLSRHFQHYRPVDWHLDYKSGYRWDPDTFYQDIKIGHMPGADVKAPWELSRFQHAPLLGLTQVGDEKDNGWGCEFIMQATDWIVSNPYPSGVNWHCTMEVAIRAINLLWGWVLLSEYDCTDEYFNSILADSLYQHGCHIEQNLEFQGRGFNSNHYLANIAGLIYIGAFLPNFDKSDHWLLFGIRELVKEFERQVYEDGVSYEGSTSYHCFVAEILFSCTSVLLNISPERRKRLKHLCSGKKGNERESINCSHQHLDLDCEKVFPVWYYERLEKMAEYIFHITKPDGNIPMLGDCDSGRLHKFTPELSDDEREYFNDHRHILAIAGRLFGRDDFTEAGKPFILDAELLLGQVTFLPVRNKAVKNEALNRSDLVLKTTRKNCTQSRVESEIILNIKPAVAENDLMKFYYYPSGGLTIYENGLYYFVFASLTSGLGGIGAHNHNDKLSFELNILGKDFIVDGGSYVYTPANELRDAFRSTWAHNTVAVKGKEQCVMIDGFPFIMADRSNTRLIQVTGNSISGNHRGFGFNHYRKVSFDKNRITIYDKLQNKTEAYFILNLHPRVKIGELGGNKILITHEQVELSVEGYNVKEASLEKGFYAPRYGKRIDNTRLLIPLDV